MAMTPKQRAVIDAARRTRTRVVEIDYKEGRIYRHTAAVNTLAKLARQRSARVLEAEQERLIRTWDLNT